jgi:Ankyrin repeat
MVCLSCKPHPFYFSPPSFTQLHVYTSASVVNDKLTSPSHELLGLVKFALDHGAGIDSVVNGYMPLQMACISDSNIAVVQYLIDRGADVNLQR